MRARYCAYALGRVAYILETTAPGSPAWDDAPDWPERVAAFCQGTRFVGLEVLDAPAPAGDEGFVTFHARLEHGGAPSDLIERSRFVRAGGRWRYHSGQPVSG